MEKDVIQILVECVFDAMRPEQHRKPDWKQALIHACDAVELEYDAMRGLLGEVADTWGDACCEPLYDYGYTLTKESKKLLNRIDTLLSEVKDGKA